MNQSGFAPSKDSVLSCAHGLGASAGLMRAELKANHLILPATPRNTNHCIEHTTPWRPHVYTPSILLVQLVDLYFRLTKTKLRHPEEDTGSLFRPFSRRS